MEVRFSQEIAEKNEIDSVYTADVPNNRLPPWPDELAYHQATSYVDLALELFATLAGHGLCRRLAVLLPTSWQYPPVIGAIIDFDHKYAGVADNYRACLDSDDRRLLLGHVRNPLWSIPHLAMATEGNDRPYGTFRISVR